MNETIEDVMVRFSDFSEHIAELRGASDIVASKKELAEAAKNGTLIARKRLTLENGDVFESGDSVPITSSHDMCEPDMVTTKKRYTEAAQYMAAKDRFTFVNSLANKVQSIRREVGDMESLVDSLSVPIQSISEALDKQHKEQEVAEAELHSALDAYYEN